MSTIIELSQENIQKAKLLFGQALLMTDDEVDALLEKECDSEALSGFVKELLSVQKNTMELQLENLDPLAAIHHSKQLSKGVQIGKFTLEKHIGSGGMGDVYLAKRQDKDIHQKVALKVLRNKLNQSAIARFHIERRIMAHLEHPGIARLIDAGFDQGMAYYAMEYISGIAINRYCKKNKLNVEQRLKLFLRVCDAVSYAHSNLIIHRDLKPSNVLINDDGEVKLVNFGVAKPLQQLPGIDELPQTIEGVVALTPQYASPEQLKAENVGVACDLYALGLLLYEILTEQLAFDFTGKSWPEIEKIIKEKMPILPSLRIINENVSYANFACKNKRGLANKIKGDLDEIIIHALKKEPRQRYLSVAGLSNDISRHLKNLPLTIKKDSRRYRLKKFIKRNFMVITGSLLITAITLMFLFTTLSKNRAIAQQSILLANEKNLAIKERNKATTLIEILINSFQNADPMQTSRKDLKAVSVMDEAVRLIEQKKFQDVALEAALLVPIVTTYNNLAEFDKSTHLIETLEPKYPAISTDVKANLVYEKAVIIASTIGINPAHEYLKDQPPKIKNTHKYKMIEAEILSERGESIQAEEKWRLIFNTLDEKHPDYLFACSELGRNINANSSGDGETILTECLKLAESNSDPTQFWGESEIKRQLANLYYQRGDLELAYQAYKEIIEMKKEVLGENHIYVLQAYRDLYKIDTHQQRFDEAMKYQKLALDGLIEYYGENHLGTVREVFNLGVLHQKMGELKLAEKQMIHAIDIVNAEDPSIGYNSHFNFNLGKLYIMLEQWAAAETYLLNSIAMYEKRNEGGEKWIAAAQSYLAEVYINLGKTSEAKKMITEVYPAVRDNFSENNEVYIQAHRIKLKCEESCL